MPPGQHLAIQGEDPADRDVTAAEYGRHVTGPTVALIQI
jgi:hypothetical protein